ncbi:GNAT family N-acetyltransferase [Arthrospiribacter ruber]|uniref:GNAT family N-acetyltransferase n=1 Tax=Arthrospiribacter ruber TaxID=2487934 RepID=A0A951IR54_9BACT|nr:GNAT family N-acetyltransferase [Arthrospiribacter ruber]MBW3466408.1 GNAT family N-acetyltransferase [Arthrospiribacter ruber]
MSATFHVDFFSDDLELSQIENLLNLVFPNSDHSKEKLKRKHLDNPHGPSIISYAKEGDNLIAFRAFWRMNFVISSKTFIGYQPCDTATHPDYRGKGFFKKLTLLALEEAKKQNVDVILNFPNNNSYPGYLKLGWIDFPKLNRYVFPVNYFNIIKSFLLSRKNGKNMGKVSNKNSCQFENNGTLAFSEKCELLIDEKYFNWRFNSNSSKTYVSNKVINNFFVLKLKVRGSLKEAEIVYAKNQISKKDINTLKKELIKEYRVDFISVIYQNSNIILNNGFFKVPNQIKFVGICLNKEIDPAELRFQPMWLDTI